MLAKLECCHPSNKYKKPQKTPLKNITQNPQKKIFAYLSERIMKRAENFLYAKRKDKYLKGELAAG